MATNKGRTNRAPNQKEEVDLGRPCYQEGVGDYGGLLFAHIHLV